MVDPNPSENTYGIVRHIDLEPATVRTSNKQTDFSPQANVAYHVTNGDDHDHVGGDGAPLRHSNFLEISPLTTNHVSNGDFHVHNLAKGDGGPIYMASIFLDSGTLFSRLDATGAATGGSEAGSGVVSNRPDAPSTPSLSNLLTQIDTTLAEDATNIAALTVQLSDIDTKATEARNLANGAAISASAALATAIAAEATAQNASNAASTALNTAQNAQTTANQALSTGASTATVASAAAAAASLASIEAHNANLAAQTALATVNTASRPTIVSASGSTAISRPSNYAFVVCTASGITITLWVGEEGDRILVKDGTGTAAITPIIVTAAVGNLIDGIASKSVAANFGCTEMVFAAGQWRKAY